MSGKFCVRCGRQSERLIDSLCMKCHLERRVAVALPSSIKSRVCRECNAVLKRGKWERRAKNLEEAVEEAGFSAIEENVRVEGISSARVGIAFLGLSRSSPKDYLARYRLEIKGRAGEEEVEFSREVGVRVRLVLCDTCQRRASRYYEAVLQIRGHAPLTAEERKELSEFVRREVEARRGEARAFISDYVELKEGLDFYLGSAKLAKRIANLLLAEYGGTITTSTKLVGMDESGKGMLRHTIAYRLPRLRRGDVVKVQGKVCEVLGLSHGRVRLLDLDTRKTLSLTEKRLQGVKILGRAEDAVKGMVTEVVKDRVQVLEFKDYKTFYFDTQLPLEVGQEVRIFKTEGRVYLLATPLEE